MAIQGLVGGSSKPIAKYDAKARTFKVDGKVLSTITWIVDIDRAEAGWIKFTDVGAPEFKLIPIEQLTNGAPYPAQPTETDSNGRPAWRRGFRTQIKLSDQVAGSGPTVREWASCALATVRSFDQLHDQWMAMRKPSMVPVVTCDSFEEEPGQYGPSYRPIWRIIKMIKRPPDLDVVPTPEASPAISSGGAPEDFGGEETDIPW